MEFDRKAVLAIVLIGVILLIMQTEFYQKRFLPRPTPLPPVTSAPDTTGKLQQPPAAIRTTPTPVAEESTSRPVSQALLRSGEGKEVVVTTDLYRAVFSTRGATLRSIELFNYLDAEERPVQLVGVPAEGNLALLLPTDGDTLDTGDLLFDADKMQTTVTGERPERTLVFSLPLQGGSRLEKTFTFHRGRYSMDLRVRMTNMDRVINGFSYAVAWKSGMASTEPDLTLDMQSAKAYAYQGDVEVFDVSDPYESERFQSTTSWVAIRTKYFATALIPRTAPGQAVIFKGFTEEIGADVPLKRYAFSLQVPFNQQPERVDEFTVYLGPLDYDTIKSYGVGLEETMDLGFAVVRPFSRFVLWSFTLLHKVVPNYGFVIVIFAFLIKIVLFPLTRKFSQSMKEMQALQPLMQEINEKHKDDQQKRTEATMKLYKEYGFNPVGGCLPMLLQMPLLFGLFNVFRSTIELRGASFIFWMTDLSRPDTIAHLPFSLPLYGDGVNILPLFMGVTMFIQQKMTIQDPKQKAMVYVMPIVFTLMFNNFPSGLNLYYALYNVLSILQDKFIPYKVRTPEELREAQRAKHKSKRAKHDYRGRKA